jgi:MFS family permease
VRLPVARTIALLGVVSLLADVAGEMLQPLLPLYLAAIGASAVAIGAVEGAAEASVSLVKVGSGRLADRWPRRKPLVVAGYSLAAVAKPLLALAFAWPAVLGLRSLDRVGKGLRGAPRDAMIGDLALEGQRGVAFGFHRMADTVGAIVGPLLVLLLLASLGQSADAMRTIFALSAIPMALCVAVLVFGVREPAVRRPRQAARAPLPRKFYAVLAVLALFALGNVSYVFMLLRTRDLGATPETAVAMYVLFNIVYAGASIPAGRLSDRHGRVKVLAASFCLFAVTSVGFALAPTLPWLIPLFVLFGLFNAAFETVGRAFAVDLAPATARATALGAYHAVVGLAALPSGLAVGLLWERVSPQAAFAFGAALALGSALLLPWAARSVARSEAPIAP